MNNLNYIKKLICITPMVEITYKFNNKINKVYVKLEWYSLTGSVKDKVAYQIILDAYKSKNLSKNQKIVEVSSGNMGISISAIGNLTKNPVTIIMPETMSDERKKLIKSYNANLVLTKDFKEAFKLCEEYKKEGYFCTNQFENLSNIKAHYNITAKEISTKIKDKKVNNFVAGVGTSGTLIGISKRLKKLNIKCYGLEPFNARILSGVKPFKNHKLQGLSDEILPKIYDKNVIDGIVQIKDDDAIAMSQKLCSCLSLGVGISSGANFLGCVLKGDTCVTVFPDDNKKYLSTDLLKTVKSDLVDKIELLNIKYL